MTSYEKYNLKDLTVDTIKQLDYYKIMALYKSLPLANFEEMDGVYDNAMVGFPSEKSEKISKWLLYNTEKGYWLGKAFTPSTIKREQEGEGYI